MLIQPSSTANPHKNASDLGVFFMPATLRLRAYAATSTPPF
jgi:hypothetical protein